MSESPPTAKAPPGSSWSMGRMLAVVVLGVLVIFFVRELISDARSDGGSGSGATVTDTTVVVVYTLTGSARSADLTYTDSAGNIQQQNGVAVPLKSKSGSEGISFTVQRGEFVQFSAQNQGESGNLKCAIAADGQIINTGNASGGYAIVSCSATVP